MKQNVGWEKWSLVSALAARTCLELDKDPELIVLKHFTGYRAVEEDKHREQDVFSGVVGVLRSLLEQMVLCDTADIDLRVADTWSEAALEQIRAGSVEAMCRLFRVLLVDVAQSAKARRRIRHVFVVIDSINILEKLEQAHLRFLVSWLRSLCDESSGSMGEWMVFKYMITNPGFSKLLEKPHGREWLGELSMSGASAPNSRTTSRANSRESTSSGDGKKKVAKQNWDQDVEGYHFGAATSEGMHCGLSSEPRGLVCDRRERRQYWAEAIKLLSRHW